MRQGLSEDPLALLPPSVGCQDQGRLRKRPERVNDYCDDASIYTATYRYGDAIDLQLD